MRAAFCGLLLALLAACAPMPPHLSDPPAPADQVVYALVNDWHTELSLPAAGISGRLARIRSIFPGARYFNFGFGERLYYQKENADWLDALRAVLPGPGTVLLTALNGAPPDMYPGAEMVALHLTQAELDRLSDYMWDTLEKTPDDRLVRLGDGKFPGYVFYGAATSYDGFYTCNTWTVQALDAAGLEAGAPGVLFAHQAMARIRAVAARRTGS
jgi:hypothetical protein